MRDMGHHLLVSWNNEETPRQLDNHNNVKLSCVRNSNSQPCVKVAVWVPGAEIIYNYESLFPFHLLLRNVLMFVCSINQQMLYLVIV